jgi:hypothetical protein
MITFQDPCAYIDQPYLAIKIIDLIYKVQVAKIVVSSPLRTRIIKSIQTSQ